MVQLGLSILRLTRTGTLAAAVAAAGLAGCALKEPPQRDEVLQEALPKGTTVPPEWQAEAGADPVEDDWLKSLDDPMLEAIVREAVANNLDLRFAAERVRMAQQSVIVAGSRLLPQIGVDLGASTSYDDSNDDNINATKAFAGLTWEVDVWGRLRSLRAAAGAEFEATELDYASARLSLAATAAKAWYLACETRQLVELSEESIGIYEELLKLVEARRDAGKDTDLDVYDTRAKLETARSNLESARQSYQEARRALETLLGRYPSAEIEVAVAYAPLSPPPATGEPATLLTRRPDIVAAERRVLAAFRREQTAELSLLPEISVSLGGGRLNDQVLSILDLNPWLATAGIGVSIPIYEGGALRARVRIATAEQAQAVARYGQTVLTAFREVENAIANAQLLAKRLTFEQNALLNRTGAVGVATEQYRAGQRDLLWVTNLQAAELATKAAVINLRALQRINRIQLLMALGGSFDAPPDTADADAQPPPEPDKAGDENGPNDGR